MYNGIINVYKEAGYTSFDVVARLRGILKQKKIGHTGTLDPDATGVLPVIVGNATKLVDMLTDKKKEYVATFRLGITTDTLDASGQVLSRAQVDASEDDVVKAVMSFKGDIMQIPPMYSALKVDGKKLCDLAREGKTVERKPRPVTIHEIEILDIDIPNVKLKVLCSKGTYIRTLCDDIGRMLGCGAVMTSLLRTVSGRFTADDAHTLDEIEQSMKQGRIEELIIPTDAVFEDACEYVAKGQEYSLVSNGNKITIPDMTCDKVKIYDTDHRFMALYELSDKKRRIYKPGLMFLNNQ